MPKKKKSKWQETERTPPEKEEKEKE